MTTLREILDRYGDLSATEVPPGTIVWVQAGQALPSHELSELCHDVRALAPTLQIVVTAGPQFPMESLAHDRLLSLLGYGEAGDQDVILAVLAARRHRSAQDMATELRGKFRLVLR